MPDHVPRVTVLMPVYNGERYLAEAIESILAQSFDGFEFLIIDDASTDGSSDLVRSYRDSRVRLVENDCNLGQTRSLNRGLGLARGEYIARLDQDDISLPNRLEHQVSLLDQQPDLVIVGSAYYVIGETGAQVKVVCPPASDTHIRWETLFHCSFAHPSVMLRADVVHRNALCYDPQFAPAEDYYLWSQLLCYGQGLNVGHPLVKRRVHAHQQSHTNAVRQRSNADRIARSNLERLGFCISDADVGKLRDWYHRLPRPLSKQDMSLCRVLLQILTEFEKQPNVDPGIVRDLRRRWIDRILSAIPAESLGDFWSSGLLGYVVRDDVPSVLAHASKRAIRRLGRALQMI